MEPDDHMCTSAEDRDFVSAAALLSASTFFFLLFGDDFARFLNSLFLNL